MRKEERERESQRKKKNFIIADRRKVDPRRQFDRRQFVAVDLFCSVLFFFRSRGIKKNNLFKDLVKQFLFAKNKSDFRTKGVSTGNEKEKKKREREELINRLELKKVVDEHD